MAVPLASQRSSMVPRQVKYITWTSLYVSEPWNLHAQYIPRIGQAVMRPLLVAQMPPYYVFKVISYAAAAREGPATKGCHFLSLGQ